MIFLQSHPVEQNSFPLCKRALFSCAVLRAFVATAALVAAVPAAFAQVMLVPSPGPVHEHIPPSRPGYMHRGYWEGEHGHAAWGAGGWMVQAPVAYGVYPI